MSHGRKYTHCSVFVQMWELLQENTFCFTFLCHVLCQLLWLQVALVFFIQNLARECLCQIQFMVYYTWTIFLTECSQRLLVKSTAQISLFEDLNWWLCPLKGLMRYQIKKITNLYAASKEHRRNNSRSHLKGLQDEVLWDWREPTTQTHTHTPLFVFDLPQNISHHSDVYAHVNSSAIVTLKLLLKWTLWE